MEFVPQSSDLSDAFDYLNGLIPQGEPLLQSGAYEDLQNSTFDQLAGNPPPPPAGEKIASDPTENKKRKKKEKLGRKYWKYVSWFFHLLFVLFLSFLFKNFS